MNNGTACDGGRRTRPRLPAVVACLRDGQTYKTSTRTCCSLTKHQNISTYPTTRSNDYKTNGLLGISYIDIKLNTNLINFTGYEAVV